MPTSAYAEAAPPDSGQWPTPGPFHPGMVLQGTYRVQERLAAGGMGEVYVAAHERLPVRVAVKVLHRDFLLRHEAVARFGREALIMAGLRHPHITQVYEFNITEDGTPYLVMELLEGQNLQTFVDRHQALPPARVATIIRQIGSALDAAHAHGIVHRDLKPENVMLMSLKAHDAFVKVFDFGISQMTGSQRLTNECTFMGTPEYMSPEQAQGQGQPVDHKTDQFALAAMAYALLTGRQAFGGDHPLGVLYQVIHHQPPPLARLVDWPTSATEKVLRRALAKRPEHRFPDLWTFSHALGEALEAASRLPVRRARPAKPVRWSAGATDRRMRRRRLFTATLTSAIAATGLCASIVLTGGGVTPTTTAALRMWRSLPTFFDGPRDTLPRPLPQAEQLAKVEIAGEAPPEALLGLPESAAPAANEPAVAAPPVRSDEAPPATSDDDGQSD
jgi:serine/threonine protein kinase